MDNVGLINETCKLAGIPRLNPDNIDLNDWEVWKDIRDDTTAIFQFESPFASLTIKQMFSEDTIEKIKNNVTNFSLLKLFSFCNALIRPCGTSIIKQASTGQLHKTGIEDIDNMLEAELGYCIIQEDIMKFLMAFCGFSLTEADLARKAIAKKKGTKELLPKIKNGFEKDAKVKYNLTQSESDEIIEPIMQCILDATRYAFSWNHSDAYSCIGYICGYLRHYYPLEFICTCFNVWKDKEEKTTMMHEYAKKKGIFVKEPMFRYSKSNYFFDKNENVIYKGMESIKFLNQSCSDELYELRNFQGINFIDLLYEINKTSTNSKQLEILIKLDYFKEFGNAKTLMKIYNMFVYFKNGLACSINKSKLENNEVLENIVHRHSKSTEKQYRITNCRDLLIECEEYIRSLNLPDYSIRAKSETQEEYLGYISISTGQKEDRTKLLVLSKKELIARSGRNIGKPWAVSLEAQSIGSGKKSSYTIFYNIYKNKEFEPKDIINVMDIEKDSRGYWYIKKYNVLGEI